MDYPKPLVITHDLRDGSFRETEPIILTWNGVDVPRALRTLRPGQYVLLPYEPPDDMLRPTKEAA